MKKTSTDQNLVGTNRNRIQLQFGQGENKGIEFYLKKY